MSLSGMRSQDNIQITNISDADSISNEGVIHRQNGNSENMSDHQNSPQSTIASRVEQLSNTTHQIDSVEESETVNIAETRNNFSFNSASGEVGENLCECVEASSPPTNQSLITSNSIVFMVGSDAVDVVSTADESDAGSTAPSLSISAPDMNGTIPSFMDDNSQIREILYPRLFHREPVCGDRVGTSASSYRGRARRSVSAICCHVSSSTSVKLEMRAQSEKVNRKDNCRRGGSVILSSVSNVERQVCDSSYYLDQQFHDCVGEPLERSPEIFPRPSNELHCKNVDAISPEEFTSRKASEISDNGSIGISTKLQSTSYPFVKSSEQLLGDADEIVAAEVNSNHDDFDDWGDDFQQAAPCDAKFGEGMSTTCKLHSIALNCLGELSDVFKDCNTPLEDQKYLIEPRETNEASLNSYGDSSDFIIQDFSPTIISSINSKNIGYHRTLLASLFGRANMESKSLPNIMEELVPQNNTQCSSESLTESKQLAEASGLKNRNIIQRALKPDGDYHSSKPSFDSMQYCTSRPKSSLSRSLMQKEATDMKENKVTLCGNLPRSAGRSTLSVFSFNEHNYPSLEFQPSRKDSTPFVGTETSFKERDFKSVDAPRAEANSVIPMDLSVEEDDQWDFVWKSPEAVNNLQNDTRSFEADFSKIDGRDEDIVVSQVFCHPSASVDVFSSDPFSSDIIRDYSVFKDTDKMNDNVDPCSFDETKDESYVSYVEASPGHMSENSYLNALSAIDNKISNSYPKQSTDILTATLKKLGLSEKPTNNERFPFNRHKKARHSTVKNRNRRVSIPDNDEDDNFQPFQSVRPKDNY